MSTFVYMTRCDGCGHCVDICPSDIMHIDENIRRAVNIEPNFCWECYSCVKACPNHAIDVRGYADFAPITTKPWGKFIPKLAEGEKPDEGEINSQMLYTEPNGLNIDGKLPSVPKDTFKKGVYY
jgi:adenylylsulfate reductase subunit B